MLVGIDEGGRGCWAGPLVAGAVVLATPLIGLRDSKKLSQTQRNTLALQIKNESLAYGLGWVQPSEIDTIGLTAAVQLAMRRALDQILIDYDEVIIDGSYNFLPENKYTRPIIKADDTVPAVSAASVIAKVARDQYMFDIAAQYPKYGFDKHVGYGTALHLERLRTYGVTPLHRQSYRPVRALMIQ